MVKSDVTRTPARYILYNSAVVAGSGSIVPIRSLQEYPCQLPVYTEEDTLSAVSSRLFQKREETKASIYKVTCLHRRRYTVSSQFQIVPDKRRNRS